MGRIALPNSEAIVLGMIEAAARGGASCPTNDEIAFAIGASSWATSSRVVAQLEARGLIAVERRHKVRIVTVRATGERTAAPPPAQLKLADGLAELVAEGASVAEAARTLGVSAARGHQVWNGIRTRLGWQAG